MEFLFLVKQSILFVLFFMNFSKKTNTMIETMMNMLMLEYPDLNEKITCCREQSGGTRSIGETLTELEKRGMNTEQVNRKSPPPPPPPPPAAAPAPPAAARAGAPPPLPTAAAGAAGAPPPTAAAGAAGAPPPPAAAPAPAPKSAAETLAEEQLKERRERAAKEAENRENAEKRLAKQKEEEDRQRALTNPNKKDLNDQRQAMKRSDKLSEEKANAAQKAQDDYKKRKLATVNAENKLNKLMNDPTASKTQIDDAKKEMEKAKEDMNKSKKERDHAKNIAKQAKAKALQDKFDHTRMSNAEYDKNNPEFEKYKDLMKDGPINGFYKILSTAIGEVVTFVKFFFYWIYQKSMMTFLPFIMTMSFGFSFIRYFFQNVRNR